MTNDGFKKGLEGLDQGAATAPGEAPAAPEQPDNLPPHPTVDALRSKFGERIQRHEVVAGDDLAQWRQAVAGQMAPAFAPARRVARSSAAMRLAGLATPLPAMS